jgi:hypothetical protein
MIQSFDKIQILFNSNLFIISGSKTRLIERDYINDTNQPAKKVLYKLSYFCLLYINTLQTGTNLIFIQ